LRGQAFASSASTGESTVAPGTMESLVVPCLESASGLVAGEDFYVGRCPQRVMPGKLLANLRT